MAKRIEQAPMTAPEIHPTAVVHPRARLGRGVRVGPYAVLEEDVSIGDGTEIAAHAVIERYVQIGRDNRIGVGAVIGGFPQHKQFAGERSFVRLGDRNVVREYVTINRAYGEDAITEIGNDNYLMSYVHIGHNCRIGDQVVLVSGAELAGYVTVEDQVNLSGHSGVHQFVRIGRLAMAGGGAIIRQAVPPFLLVAGNPARAYGLNVVGLTRAGIAAEHISALKQAFRLLYRSRLGVRPALEQMERDLSADSHVRELIEFIRNDPHGRGIVGAVRTPVEPDADD